MDKLRALIAEWDAVRPADGYDAGYLTGLMTALEILEED